MGMTLQQPAMIDQISCCSSRLRGVSWALEATPFPGLPSLRGRDGSYPLDRVLFPHRLLFPSFFDFVTLLLLTLFSFPTFFPSRPLKRCTSQESLTPLFPDLQPTRELRPTPLSTFPLFSAFRVGKDIFRRVTNLLLSAPFFFLRGGRNGKNLAHPPRSTGPLSSEAFLLLTKMLFAAH